jgi:AhpD family alkylhydroperoxidase
MPFLPSVNVDDKVPHVLAKFNTGTGRPLIEYHEALLRGDSPFTVAERETMAAYISGVNACHYCHGAHTAAAGQFGVASELIADLLKDVSTAGIPAKMVPVLYNFMNRFVEGIGLTPIPEQFEMEGRLIKEGSYKGMLDAFGIV